MTNNALCKNHTSPLELPFCLLILACPDYLFGSPVYCLHVEKNNPGISSEAPGDKDAQSHQSQWSRDIPSFIDEEGLGCWRLRDIFSSNGIACQAGRSKGWINWTITNSDKQPMRMEGRIVDHQSLFMFLLFPWFIQNSWCGKEIRAHIVTVFLGAHCLWKHLLIWLL
jgi:hypothetical protein